MDQINSCLQDFYTVTEQSKEENEWKGMVRFNNEHSIFNGHFPGQPVVPGVCTLTIVTEIAGFLLCNKLQLVAASQVKYLRLLLPDDPVEVSLVWTVSESDIQINSVWKVGDQTAFKMTGVLQVCK